MLPSYERRLIFFYLSNVVPHLRGRDEEAKNLLLWLSQHEDQLGLPYLLREDDEAARVLAQGLRDQDVPARVWQRVEAALRTALEATRHVRPDRTARRLRHLARTTRLSRTDTAILELLLHRRTGSLVALMIDALFEDLHWTRSGVGVNNPFVPRLLGLSAAAVHRRMAPDAPLLTSGLVSIDDDGDLTLINRLTRLHWVPREAGFEVQRLLLDEAGPGELRWSDFDHVAGDRDQLERILRGALRSGRKGVNVLVYGPPGTGKTEFCKTLAARLEAPLYVVGESDAAGGEPSRQERIQELRLAQRLLAEDRRSILLFDEMEDLLSGQGEVLAALFGSRRAPARSAEGSKVFMNRLLEQTPVPILWTSNVAGRTSPVLLRRMMFALELRQPPPKVRARIWARQLAHHGIEATEEDAHALTREFDVTPGVASGVTAAAGLGGGTVTDVRRGVRGLARVLSADKPPVQRPPDKYDPALIRADVEPVQLADRLVASGARHFSLSLQGPPGTGKSAFVRYLADRLGLEVVQKRASDLMSMWVGGTEANIAEAFAEARDAEAFLVFDEADSLLADRRLAERSWEVSQVNEMLTWMESHPFPVAFTTNFGERLDPATLRRFTFKIALDYLSPEQAIDAFCVYFDIEPAGEIADLRVLTPGDFAVVLRKGEILGCLRDPKALAEMLRAECEAKSSCPRGIGFAV
ncbi:MAG: AAA family ATPase [Deltaproteobacteria bacterium]|nr:AAA family ATPase [Deltaproteobacteria bacterium]